MTEEKKKKPKTVFEERFTCPHCKERVIIRKIKKIISDPVPGEYEEKTIVEKDTQTTLKN